MIGLVAAVSRAVEPIKEPVMSRCRAFGYRVAGMAWLLAFVAGAPSAGKEPQGKAGKVARLPIRPGRPRPPTVSATECRSDCKSHPPGPSR